MAVKYSSNFDSVKRKVNDTAAKRAFAAANKIKSNWVRKLTGEGTGREYRVPGTNRTYIASSPGEPPATMFGDLRQSPKLQVFEEGKNYGYAVGSGLKKAVWLEKGTSKMKPRPSLRPAARETEREIGRLLGKEWF